MRQTKLSHKRRNPYRNYTTLKYTRFRHISIFCLFSEYFGQYFELVKLQQRTKAGKQINFQMIYLMILRPSYSIKNIPNEDLKFVKTLNLQMENMDSAEKSCKSWCENSSYHFTFQMLLNKVCSQVIIVKLWWQINLGVPHNSKDQDNFWGWKTVVWQELVNLVVQGLKNHQLGSLLSSYML